MSSLAPLFHERRAERPTSRRAVYDVRYALADDEPRFIHENFRTPLADTHRRLRQMLSWPENWDREGSAKPNVNSILKAIRWIDRMRADATRTGNRWVEPHTVADENGDVAFEWWRDNRNLIVYVSPQIIDYLQVWGSDIDSEMVDGEIRGSEDNQKLWRWLME